MLVIVCPIQLFSLNQKIYLHTLAEEDLTFLDESTLENLPEKLVYWANRMNAKVHLYTNDTFAQEIINRIKTFNNLIEIEVN